MILVLSDLWLPFPGGAERLMFNLARDLHRRRRDVVVLTSYDAAREFDGPPVLITSVGVFDRIAEGAAVVTAAIEDLRPDVIVTHHLFAYQFEALLADCGVPVVQVVLNGRRLTDAALAVFISGWVRSQPESMARSRDLTITPPAFADVIADHHGDAVGFIKPIPHKGVALVYELVAAMPDRRFVILRGEWQTLEDIRPRPNVEFMEPVADIRDFYARCRVVLMPSISEDAGTVAQEAALNRIPCISTDVGGLAQTNRGGVLLKTRDIDDWVAALARLDDPFEYRRVVERQARHFAGTRQEARLDRLAERIAQLGARSRVA